MASTTIHWRILVGAVPAFIIQCGLAVAAGQLLKTTPHQYISLTAGLLFIYFARSFWIESRKPPSQLDSAPNRSILSIFLLFFFAELGDVSQLAIAARAAQVEKVLSVFLGAALAMTVIAFLAVFAGRLFSRLLRPATMQILAAIFFFLLGIYLIATSLRVLFA